MKKQQKPDVMEITKEQKAYAADIIRDYVSENFDTEISGMQAGFFVDFISENLGKFYYNNAIAESIAFMTEKAEDLYLLMKNEDDR